MENSVRAVMADHPDHPDRVLLEPLVRGTDRSNDPSLEIPHAADEIDNGKIGDIVEEPVDGDIPSKGILLGCSETLRTNDMTFFRLHFFKLGTASERGDLDDFSPMKKDMNESKATADNSAVFEQGFDLVGMGIGSDIEISRCPSREKVADASSNEVGQEAMMVQAVEGLQGLLIDHLSRDRMFSPRDDERSYRAMLIAFGVQTLIH